MLYMLNMRDGFNLNHHKCPHVKHIFSRCRLSQCMFMVHLVINFHGSAPFYVYGSVSLQMNIQSGYDVNDYASIQRHQICFTTAVFHYTFDLLFHQASLVILYFRYSIIGGSDRLLIVNIYTGF